MQEFSSSSLEKFQKPLFQESMYVFLSRLLSAPNNFEDHIRLYVLGFTVELTVPCVLLIYHCLQSIAGGNILTSIYGIPYNEQEPYIEMISKAMDAFSEAAIPGSYLVDTISMLRYVPTWFPFVQFKKKASYERKLVEEMVTKPLEYVKENIVIDSSFYTS